MRKVMILDYVLQEVIALEDVLKGAGYEVCVSTGMSGVLSKFDYEKPDILLINPDMPNIDTDMLIETLHGTQTMSGMIIVLICTGDPVAVETYCRAMNVNGYYLVENGFSGIPLYLSKFYET